MTYRSGHVTARIALLLGGLCLTQLCFAGKVQVWMEKGADFSKYKTYEWLPPKILASTGIVENDPEYAPLIKEAVDRQLALKGLKQVSHNGDLQVSTLVLAQSIAQLEGFLFAGTPPDFFTAPVAAVARYNREGTLIVNLIDAKMQRSAWCGMATESVNRDRGSGKKKIAPAAAKLFKKFPRKASTT
jgi:Domain of unknown function (DUF4136)